LENDDHIRKDRFYAKRIAFYKLSSTSVPLFGYSPLPAGIKIFTGSSSASFTADQGVYALNKKEAAKCHMKPEVLMLL
jgi:hypothetical protein